VAEVDPSVLEAQVLEARASLATVQSNLQYQQSNFDRQEQLFKLGAISKAEFQLAQNQFNSAKASINNAEAFLSIAEKNLSYTKIYSPISGVVLNRNVSAGQTIASSFNAPVLFVIARDLTKMQVNANVDEADIGGIVGGLDVSFTVDAFPTDIFRGIVQKIYLHPAVSANVVTYTTLISVDNQDLKLKPGMTASISIYLAEDTNALLIPSKALSFKPDSTQLKNYVIIKGDKKKLQAGDSTRSGKRTDSLQAGNQVEPDTKFASVWLKTGDTLTRRRIVIGMNDDTNVKVISGLRIQDDVVTGIESAGTKKSSGKQQQSQSPFMPRMQRPANTQRGK
jgi:HlyD family secretion protein